MNLTKVMRDLFKNLLKSLFVNSLGQHRYLNISLLIAMLTLIGVALFSSWSIYQLREAIRYERQSNTIKENVHNVYELIQGAESSQRGYLLTGKTEYLATYMTSFPEIPKAVEQLKRSVVFLPDHLAAISELDELLVKKLGELKLTVVLQQAEKEDDALALIQTDRGEALMNRIHAVLDGVDRDARKEALRHQTFVRRYASGLNLTIALGTATTLLLVLLFAFFTRDEIGRRTRSEHELRTAQDAALIASKLKSQFLATVSHEIRTPLNGIIGMSDLLRGRLKDPEHRRYTDIIHHSGHALLKIVNDILDFSKIEAGKIDFEFSDFTLIDMVESTVELYSAQTRSKGLALASYTDPAIPLRVVGDASRISQILRNLIANAVKFTEAGGVTVRARLMKQSGEKNLVRFEVQDTGRGIAAKHHALLFQPFNQVPDGGIRQEGTGLGLSICKDLTDAMGGVVGFDSTFGRGSVFWCEIPLTSSSEISVGAVTTVSTPPDGVPSDPFHTEQPTELQNVKTNFSSLAIPADDGQINGQVRGPVKASALILIVEDNQTNQLLAELFLSDLGHRTHTVANGLEAVEALSRITYDVILMDCQMPVMDGFEATRLIRARQVATGQHTPIIAMTANALATDQTKCLEAGMDDFLAKPFQGRDLANVISRWVQSQKRGAVDWAVLDDLAAKTNPTVVSRLIQSFLKTLATSLSEIRRLQADADRQALRGWAHQLKSSSASLGALDLYALCVRLEEAIDTSNPSAVIEAATDELVKNGDDVLFEFQEQTRYAPVPAR